VELRPAAFRATSSNRWVEADLSVMEPSYLEDPSGDSKRLRRALYCAGMCVAAASGDVSEHEYHALRTLLGAKEVIQRETIEEIRAELETLMGEIRTTATPLSRAQLVQHATVVAAADGVVSPAEQAVLDEIAAGLGVDPRVIDQTLAGAAAPMD
jgi:tellurite resistance protein